jgi:uncharacterized membrane protein
MAGALYMDAVLRPHRSLSPRGFVVLISVVTAANCAAAAVFLSLHAHLVPLFLGVDVAAIATALAASFRSAEQVERVQVGPYEIRVTRETPRASAVIWESPTAFTRVEVDHDPADGYVTGCRLRLSSREVTLAAALGPKERAEFAKALETALWRAKRGFPLP